MWNLLVVFVGLILFGNFAGYIDVSVPTVIALALGVVGLALVLSSVYGRARGLIALGIVMCVLLVPSGWHTSTDAGSRTWQPQAAAVNAETSYSLGMGDATLDLRPLVTSLQDGAGTTISARVGVGKLLVLIPSDLPARYTFDAKVPVGDIGYPGVERRSGLNQQWPYALETTGASDSSPTVHLDLTVDVGNVEVRYDEA